jgi:hypothetical protein
MVVIFKAPESRYAKERLSGDELKDKTAETPDVEGSVESTTSENQLRSPKTAWSKGLGGQIGEEIGWFGTRGLVGIRTETGTSKKPTAAHVR